MKEIKKLLYLLQLEEYQTERYFSWLKKHPIKKLEERKNKLRWTPRVIFTLVISVLLSPFVKAERAVGFANRFLEPIFEVVEEIIVLLAKLKLKFYPHLVKIIITGSYGKTTFKEMLAYVLEAQYSVLKTPQNINTRLGIAQIIIKKLKKEHQVMIIEAGAYQEGEIRRICQLVRPSFGAVAIIGWMHLERFKTLTNIRRTKLELVPFIKDKEKLFLPPKNHQFINFRKTVVEITRQLNVSPKAAEKQFRRFTPPAHRLTAKKVNRNLIILDDTYNSNPLGFKKALKTLKSYQKYQKIVVTPGMIELGNKQFSLNKEVAKEAAAVADILVVVGETNKRALKTGAGEARKKNLRIIYLKKDESLDESLTAYLKPPTAILLENELPDHYF